MAKSQTVGIIGLGKMGKPIAEELVEANTPLMVWDTSPKARKPFEKLKCAEVAEPSTMASKCAVIIFVVPSSPDVADCLKGKAGILKNAAKGLVLYDFTTSDPAETRKLGCLAEKSGVAYLDAGMGRGLTRKLVLMIGGDQKAFRRTKKFLAPIVERTFHLGELGSGHAMKLVHNMVLHTIFLATCEGARMTERMGMKVSDMVDVFNVSTAFSYASRHRFPNNILNGSWNGQARIYNPWKDVGIAVRLARECGADVGFGERTLDFLERAISRGMIEQDYSLLYRDYEEILSTQPEKDGKPSRRQKASKRKASAPDRTDLTTG